MGRERDSARKIRKDVLSSYHGLQVIMYTVNRRNHLSDLSCACIHVTALVSAVRADKKSLRAFIILFEAAVSQL